MTRMPLESVMHAAPLEGEQLTPCCGRDPADLPATDRLSPFGPQVTCAGVRPLVIVDPPGAPLTDDELFATTAALRHVRNGHIQLAEEALLWLGRRLEEAGAS